MNTPDLFAGVDNLSLDKRKFDPSQNDIESICRFFSLGRLQHYEKEKDIIVSHANFFVFVATDHGQFAFKFYPKEAAKTIAIEYAINRLLIDHHFATPLMHAGHGGQPFFPSNGRLATCFAYIDGLPAWQCLKGRNTFPKINAAMLSLKNILSSSKKRIPFLKQESLLSSAGALTQDSRSMTPYTGKKIIDTSLLDACRTYQHHRALFTRQWLHNNTNLTNFLIDKKTVYTLDLSHIREDYALCDLASLVISCLFFNTPNKTINTLTKDYFTRHKIKQDHFPVLNTLIKIGLVREYLKNIQRAKSPGLAYHPPDLVRTFTFHLSERKKFIIATLKKMNDNPSNEKLRLA